LQDNELQILEFASKALSRAEYNWPTYEKEAFAIRWAVGKFEDYVKTGDILVVTDHKSLEWMESATSGKVRRWALYLQQFDLEVRHINGLENCLADWLSRSLESDDPYSDDEAVCIPTFIAAVKRPRDFQENITTVVPRLPTHHNIKEALKNITPDEEKMTFEGQDGLRYSLRTQKLFIPVVWRESFLFWMHGSRFGSHCGVNRTIRRLARWVWWPGLSKDVREFVKGCLVCTRMALPSKPQSVIGVLSRPLPLQLISMDCVGPRTWWNSIFYYVVIIDHASRFIVAKSTLVPPTSAWLISVLKELWLSVFQAPMVILTDRGSEFISSEFRNFCLNFIGCSLVHTSAYYPQGNAINESSH